MIWRGPMATRALDQLLRQTAWKGPRLSDRRHAPGTGDIKLSPEPANCADHRHHHRHDAAGHHAGARKGVRIFRKVGVPDRGVIENMAVHVLLQLRPCRAYLRRGRRSAWRRSSVSPPRRAAAETTDPRAGRRRLPTVMHATRTARSRGLYRAVRARVAVTVAARPATSRPRTRPSRSAEQLIARRLLPL